MRRKGIIMFVHCRVQRAQMALAAALAAPEADPTFPTPRASSPPPQREDPASTTCRHTGARTRRGMLEHANRFLHRRVVVGGVLWVELVDRYRLSGPLDGHRNAAGEHLGEVELALNSARSAFSQSMIRWASA